MEKNLRKMADHARRKQVGLRPHTKTHKCPIIAKKQIELGAVGVCAAKVSEAEVMVESGINDVHITSPVVTTEKISRVVALAQRSAGIQVVVDNARTIDDFDRAARAAGIELAVLVDLDIGTGRTGSPCGEPALALAQQIARCKSLRFEGLQAYAGHVMHVHGHGPRKQQSLDAFMQAVETKALIEKAGIEVRILTGGGTGSFDIDCEIEGVTDLQVGSYMFMDVEYRDVGDAQGEVFDCFEPALFVLVTAISQPLKDRITVDGGYKALATDTVRPKFRDITGLAFEFGGDEHGIVKLNNPSREVNLGEKMFMIVSHCDPTVNLYDHYHVYRGDRVEELWPIAARGKSQ
jgi:D-serine deaminase-like pyridoxal phosphate-dependent protein